MSGWNTRTLAWCLAALVVAGTVSAQSATNPTTPGTPKERPDDVFLGDGGGSELPGPSTSAPKAGSLAGQLKPGTPGAPTLTPGAGGGGGVVTPPDDGPPDDDGHGDPPDDDGTTGPPDDGGDGPTPGSDDDPPDDGSGSTPGVGDQDSAAPTWRLTAQQRGDTLRLQLDVDVPDGSWQLRLSWHLPLPVADRR